MKVLILITSSNKRTGFGNKTYNEQEVGLAKALTRCGIQCGIAYYGGRVSKSEEIEFDVGKIKFYLLKGRDFLKTSIFENYDSICKEYDILMPITYDHYETYHLAMKYPEKTIVYQGTYYSPFNKRYNFKCKIFDRFMIPGYKRKKTEFVMKNRLSEEFLNQKGLHNTNVIGVGFDSEQMKSDQYIESDFSKKILKIKQQGYRILLYIGRIEPRRNILFLLQVINKIAKEEKVKLVIIGKGSSRYIEKCRKLIDQLGLKTITIYKECLEQPYLPKIYSMADLFLLPTEYDIFGMVILEAMYFGVPVLSTRNGGSDILIENNKFGYIIRELDVSKWATKVLEILKSDQSLLINKAHERIEREFTWDALSIKFIDVFNSKIIK